MEVYQIKKNITRDNFGRIVYENFSTIFENTRFDNLKKQLFYDKLTPTEQDILHFWQKVEEMAYVPTSLKGLSRNFQFIHTGKLDFRKMTNALLSAKSKFKLNLLELNIIFSAVQVDDHGKFMTLHLIPYCCTV